MRFDGSSNDCERGNKNVRFERDSKKKSPNRNWNESNQIKSPLRESEGLAEKRSSGRLTLPSPIAVEFGIVGIRKNGRDPKNGTEQKKKEEEKMRKGERKARAREIGLNA